MEILLSVVIPLFNKVNSIQRAVDSVLAQTHTNFELIIVNDGSTDNSFEVIKNYKDSRIRIINTKNFGVSYARNLGVSQSTTNYVCLLDADDEWYDGFLEEIVSLVKYDPNAALYSCRYEIINELGDRSLGSLSVPTSHFGKLENFYNTYTKSRSLVCSSCVCINKHFFDSIGGFPVGKRTGEDIYVWLTLNKIGYSCFSAKTLALIHRDAENRTVTRVKREVPYHLDYYLFINYSKNKDLNRFCLRNSVLFALEAKRNGDTMIYRKYLKVLKSKSVVLFTFVKAIGFLPNSSIFIVKELRNIVTLN